MGGLFVLNENRALTESTTDVGFTHTLPPPPLNAGPVSSHQSQQSSVITEISLEASNPGHNMWCPLLVRRHWLTAADPEPRVVGTCNP